MRRRSERKKSVDISSPAPNLRKTSRKSKKSPLQTIEGAVEQHQSTENQENAAEENSDSRQSSSPCSGEKALTQKKVLKNEDQTDKLLPPTGNENDTILDLIIYEEDSSHLSKLEPIFLESENAENKETLNFDEKTNEPLSTGVILEKIEQVQEDNKVEDNDSIEKNKCSAKREDYVINLKSEKEPKSDAITLKKEKISYLNQKLSSDVSRVRKRKWISKKQTEALFPILSISTDSLKNLISDVKPVPLSDIKLDSSPDVEEVGTDKEDSPDRSPLRDKYGILEPQKMERDKLIISKSNSIESVGAGVVPYISFRSPSPSKNEATDVLYITNLVRPFTVLQLKGLLARTGKIVDDGFWIDRIKSKCYVQYETEDEAIETRHALHGIRWPTSNPKCLNVDFGRKEDMKRAILSTKDDTLNLCQDNAKENCGSSSYFPKDDKKIKPVREWDVGKNNDPDAEKRRDREKARSSERQKDRDLKDSDIEKNEKKHTHIKKTRSYSVSPVRKQKKKDNDPPLRLLDDLFRKTQTTPSIYWLPLTPEQIAEKETIRKKRLDEQQLRIQQREIEREKAYEREKERNREKHRDREKDQRLDRSIDRRKSRSRERRRY